MWQNILHISKESFVMSQKMNPSTMKIFVKYSIMSYGMSLIEMLGFAIVICN